jgi:membrane protein implicated in regulation of membrane protease activity
MIRSMSIPVRYCLLQLPGIGFLILLLWWAIHNQWIPPLVGLAILAIWLLTDAALYPLSKRALEPGPASGTDALLGRETEVVRPLAPLGQVRFGGERWLARTRRGKCVEAGHRIRVVGAEGLVLIVEPLEQRP